MLIEAKAFGGCILICEFLGVMERCVLVIRLCKDLLQTVVIIGTVIDGDESIIFLDGNITFVVGANQFKVGVDITVGLPNESQGIFYSAFMDVDVLYDVC